MCGIAGFQGQYGSELLTRMAARLAHRGPDDEGIATFPEHRVGLAHRRLSIIDLSPLGHQPMFDPSGQVAIVFNGEIYNYRALKTDLEQGGWRFRGHSDTEVLLALYLAQGVDMLKRLNGIFAFAIWDGRRRSLFLARDGLGVKPLYFTQSPRGFAFASELKALLCLPDLDRTINANALRAYLTYLWCPAPDTPLQAVSKLPPGAALIVQDGRITRQWTHYELPVHGVFESVRPAESIDAVRAAVREAVRRQMVADVPVGAFLSGGLDSSAVAAFAQEAMPHGRLQCFSIELDDADAAREGMTADLPFARKVARHLGVDLHTVRVGPEMADAIPEMLYHLDEPEADPAPLNALFIARLARRQGIKVLLSGAGGDDIFSGYRRHRALSLERYWARLPAALRGALAHAARNLPLGVPGSRRLSKAFAYAHLTPDERLLRYFWWLDRDEAARLLSPALRSQLSGIDPVQDTLARLPASTPPLQRMLHLECRHFLADHNLNYTDKMGMAAGVEVRVPLLDVDLVALAARLPPGLKQRGSEGKWVFKKAMEPLLPREVIYRPKTGFGAPLRAWLKGPLAGMLGDILSVDTLKRRGWFDPVAVEALRARDRLGQVDGAYPLFALLCIELWARQFIDGHDQTGSGT